MNRTIGRMVLATAAALAVAAISAPALADGGHAHGGGFAANRGGNSSAGRGSYGSGAARGNSNAGRGGFMTDRGGGAHYSSGGTRAYGGDRGGGARYSTGGRDGLGRNLNGGWEGRGRPLNGGSQGRGRNLEGGGGSRQFNGGHYVTGGQALANPRYSSPSRAGGNYSVPGRSYYGGAPRSYVRPGGSEGHVYSGSHYVHPAPTAGGQRNFSRPGYSRPGSHLSSGYGSRPHWDGRRYWNGGYFHGHYWPRAYYRPGFITFLPVLPAVYSTFWWCGLSYYYANDHYYTWSDDRYGYVVTDPPPAVESGSADAGDGYADSSSESSSSDSAASIYVYPKNGQSEEQTATDRFECHQWAVSQTGFDPTNGTEQSPSSSSPADYRRAMLTCLDARGYSAN